MLVADGDTVAQRMKTQLQRDDIRVVRNGIDTERFTPGDHAEARQRLGLPLGVLLLGCSGRLEPVKGQRVLIAALSQLPSRVHLTLAGGGSMATDLRQLAQTLGLEQRVHFLGLIDDMPSFYRALDVFCLPSFNEGLPLAPLEAQACGVPAAVTDVGGASETLCPQSGQLLLKGDSAAMAAVLKRMFQPLSSISPRVFVQQHWDVRLMAQAYRSLRGG